MAKTITINGVQYDVQTGLRLSGTVDPVTESKPAKTHSHTAPHAAHAKSVHTKTQRSQRLHSKYTKKSSAERTTTHTIHKPSSSAKPLQTTSPRSPQIRKFADVSSPRKVVRPSRIAADIKPVTHPVVQRAQKKHTSHQQAIQHTPKQLTSKEIKKQAISTALAQAKSTHELPKMPLRKRLTKQLSLASGGLAVMLLAGYFTYINIPSVSVRVAAVQAGIDAGYPGYHPDGYKLNGPVAYSNGSVQLTFSARGSQNQYTLQQQKSSWDSTALLENYVQPQAGTEYVAYNDSGITIYTYDSNAAWVNGGILYTLDSTAQLSNEQVRKIATSL